MKRAVIDIGSNSVVLLVTDGQSGTKTARVTRLGEGLHTTGRLSDEAAARTVGQIEAFKREAEAAGAERIYAYATEAVRRAENGEDFVRAVNDRTGIYIDVISGKAEAAIAFYGVAADSSVPSCVIDVGGASTEIVTGAHGVITYSHSFPIGAVTLRDMGYKGQIFHYTEEIFARSRKPSATAYYAIGGSSVTLAAIAVRQTVFDQAAANGVRLSRDFVRSIALNLLSLGDEERLVRYPVAGDRSRVIQFGAAALYSAMAFSDAPHVTVSTRGGAEGYIYCKERGMI